GGEEDEESSLARLDRWFAQHRPGYHHALLPGATPEELARLDSELGRPLPGELRELLAWHNGQNPQAIGCFRDNWILMSTTAIAKAKHELDSDTAGENAKSGWKPSLIPFLDDNGGNYLCVDASQPSAPVHGFWLGRTDQAAEAPSIAAWLRSF